MQYFHCLGTTAGTSYSPEVTGQPSTTSSSDASQTSLSSDSTRQSTQGTPGASSVSVETTTSSGTTTQESQATLSTTPGSSSGTEGTIASGTTTPGSQGTSSTTRGFSSGSEGTTSSMPGGTTPGESTATSSQGTSSTTPGASSKTVGTTSAALSTATTAKFCDEMEYINTLIATNSVQVQPDVQNKQDLITKGIDFTYDKPSFVINILPNGAIVRDINLFSSNVAQIGVTFTAVSGRETYPVMGAPTSLPAKAFPTEKVSQIYITVIRTNDRQPPQDVTLSVTACAEATATTTSPGNLSHVPLEFYLLY